MYSTLQIALSAPSVAYTDVIIDSQQRVHPQLSIIGTPSDHLLLPFITLDLARPRTPVPSIGPPLRIQSSFRWQQTHLQAYYHPLRAFSDFCWPLLPHQDLTCQVTFPAASSSPITPDTHALRSHLSFQSALTSRHLQHSWAPARGDLPEGARSGAGSPG